MTLLSSFTRRDALTMGLASAVLSPKAHAAPRSSDWARRKKKARVHGREMAYVEVGSGAPIVFLHGNPTSSYLWRNIIPHVQHLGRCIAPDLIGMGDSDKLPESGPGRYSLRDHQHYLYALLDALHIDEDVVLVLQDWGSALGFCWARQDVDRIRGIAYMEAILEPPGAPTPPAPAGSFFAKLRSPEGERFVLAENGFVERLISALDLYLTDEDAREYRRPFLSRGEGRRPMLDWPRQLPLGGEPPHMYELVRSYSDWLVQESATPKLFVRADPGGLIAGKQQLDFVRQARKQTEVTVYGPHFVQEVSPNAIGRALARWIAAL
jgi:haloalkane dehalogenase